MDWDQYYLNIAKTVLEASTCIHCQCGAVIVDKNNQVISTGYSHSINDAFNCKANGKCEYARIHGRNPKFGKQEECVALHAELFAIMSANRDKLKDATIYIVGYNGYTKKYNSIIPDITVNRIMQAVGISRIVTLDPDIHDSFGYIEKEHVWGDVND